MSKKGSNLSTQMAQLDELLAWFDGDDFEIEAAMVKFSEAKQLADKIEKNLEGMKNTITVLSEKFSED